MAFQLNLEIPITVNDAEQATAILEAVASGLAEIAIKDRVLYGNSGVQQVVTESKSFSEQDDYKRKQSMQEVKPVEFEAPKLRIIEDAEEKPEKPRSRGVLGHRRMGRT